MKKNPIDKAIKYFEKEADIMFEKGGTTDNQYNGQAVGIKYCALPRIKQVRRELIKEIQAEIDKYNNFYSKGYLEGLKFTLNLIKKGDQK